MSYGLLVVLFSILSLRFLESTGDRRNSCQAFARAPEFGSDSPPLLPQHEKVSCFYHETPFPHFHPPHCHPALLKLLRKKRTH